VVMEVMLCSRIMAGYGCCSAEGALPEACSDLAGRHAFTRLRAAGAAGSVGGACCRVFENEGLMIVGRTTSVFEMEIRDVPARDANERETPRVAADPRSR